MPWKRYRMPPVIEETRPKTERPKKALRAETGDETKWATSPRVPCAYNRGKYYDRTEYKPAPRVQRERVDTKRR